METNLEFEFDDFDRWIKSVWKLCEGGETRYERHWRRIMRQIESRAGGRLWSRIRTHLDWVIVDLCRIFRREDIF